MKLFLSLSLFFAFLACPAACADGVRDGLALSALEALPALFPFFVACGLLTRTGALDAPARVLSRPLRTLYGLPPEAAPAVVLGLIGGYPVGAAAVADLVAQGALRRADAERAIAFCCCASPGFCVALGGLALFGSAKAGAALYVIHAASALLAGLVVARGAPSQAASGRSAPRPAGGFAAAFCGAVQDAAGTALTVTAFLTVFSVLLNLLAPVLAVLPGAPVFSGLLELTNGLDRLRETGLPAAVLLPLCSFLLGFGGLSVHCQVRAIAAPYGLSMRRFTLGKALHGGFAAALTALLQRFFPAPLPVFAAAPAAHALALDRTAAVALVLLIVLFPIWGGKKSDDAL